MSELSLLDETYLNIKDMIIRGKYSPGSHLAVSKLSEELGVSHTPINEALNRLVLEGYVDFLPRRGMKVKALDFSEIIGAYEIRKMIELYCVDEMVEYAKNVPEYLKELKRCTKEQLDRGYDDRDKESMEQYFNYESYFHLLLITAKDNPQIYNLYKNLKSNGMFYYVLASTNNRLAKQRYVKAMKEHQDIIKALESGSARKLKTALSKHIDKARRSLVESVNLSDGPGNSMFIEHLNGAADML